MTKLVIYNEGHATAGAIDLESDDEHFERGTWMADVRAAHRVRRVDRAILATHRTVRECAIELITALGGNLDRRVRGVALRHHDDHVLGAAALELHARRPADFELVLPPRKADEDSGSALAVVHGVIKRRTRAEVGRDRTKGQRARWAAFRAAAGYYVPHDLAELTGIPLKQVYKTAKAAGVVIVKRGGRCVFDRASAQAWIASRNEARINSVVDAVVPEEISGPAGLCRMNHVDDNFSAAHGEVLPEAGRRAVFGNSSHRGASD